MSSIVSLEYYQRTNSPVTIYSPDLSQADSVLMIPLKDITLKVINISTSQIDYYLEPNPNFSTVIDVYKYAFWGGGSIQDGTWDSYTLSAELHIDDGSYSQSNEVWNAMIRQQAQDGTWTTHAITTFSSGSGARTTIQVKEIETGVLYE
ncbi:MAG: hypothetical protein FWF79_01175 [Defluviitaleaceae bacterium]|nr:hypothetical protein [Defluviitaleaceae bacterium]